MADTVLTLNAGSSSIKFALYRAATEPEQLARGQVENLGSSARLKISGRDSLTIGKADHKAALNAILEHAEDVSSAAAVAGVGHRIVHGGVDHSAPQRLDADALARLRALEPLAPLHQPHNLAAVEAATAAFPGAVQIGCFDTAFHRGHPWVNDTFALPRRYYDQGVRRYGFHGLSYDYVSGALAEHDAALAAGKVVIVHLGNGASMCGLQNGRSIGSSMGFSALDGLPMGTRCGQLDPGVMLYLLQHEKLSADQISDLLYRDSGLKGLSGISHDMRELEASNAPEAIEAIDYFVFRIRRELGAMAAVLGGLDALVFCGGIGENSTTIRARVCEDMGWLGIAAVDPAHNRANATEIGGGGRVRVLVIPTDEERVIARAVCRALREPL